ncbi:SQLE [Bugula neritina]|uniref:Squalene monooxygenase n=2 Tax=Bugula neritina TaxID=10212 RepID=A0A7J7JV71_BUGNE|nr:SQLE [Bugula neritina]
MVIEYFCNRLFVIVKLIIRFVFETIGINSKSFEHEFTSTSSSTAHHADTEGNQYRHGLVIFLVTLVFIIAFGYASFFWRKLTAFCLTNKIKKPSATNRPCHEFSHEEKERIVVVGAGVLGSCIATVLARDDRKVTLIERDLKEPDRIIGELLQPGGCQVLRNLGLDECLVSCEEAQSTTGYIIHDWKTGASVHIPYPKASDNQCKEGKAFRHGKFIMSLREAARKESNIEIIEGTVQALIEDNGVVTGVTYRPKKCDDSQEIRAPLVIIADGGFSKFRKHLHSEQVHVSSHFVGCIMKNCPQVKANHAELVLSNPNPILIYRISDEETRVLVDIRCQTLPKNIKEYLLEETLPYLPEHLAAPFEDGVLNERVRSMPCKFLPPSTARKDGVLMLGDAFNMRHPLTGGGMSVAFNDIYIWRELFKEISDLTNYQQVEEAYSRFQNRRKMTHSFVVNILAQALYELFSANDELCLL